MKNPKKSPADLVTFTEGILNGKLFLCSALTRVLINIEYEKSESLRGVLKALVTFKFSNCALI